MHNMFRDFAEGDFIPSITVSKREDNGHYVAESMGIRVTHHDQEQAVHELTARLQEGVLKGELHP